MATKYWVLGSGNSNDTAHWSDSDGGAGGATVPDATTDVEFTIHSNEPTDAAYTFTVNAAFACKNFTMTNPSAGQKITWAGSGVMTVSGDLNLAGGSDGITMTYASASSLYLDTNSVITTNGVPFTNGLHYNNAAGTFSLGSDLTITGSNVFLTSLGTFNSNGYAISCYNMRNSIGNNTQTINITNSTITITGYGTVALNFFSGTGVKTLTATGSTLLATGCPPPLPRCDRASWSQTSYSSFSVPLSSSDAFLFLGMTPPSFSYRSSGESGSEGQASACHFRNFFHSLGATFQFMLYAPFIMLRRRS